MTSFREMPAAARLSRVRSAMVTNPEYAFYGCIAMPLKLTEAAHIETAATDGKSLFYNPAYVESLDELESLGLWLHETEHLTGLHHVRRGSRDLTEWNVACDLAINGSLKKRGIKLPSGALYDPSFDGKSAEEIFRIRAAMRPKPSGPDEDDSPEDKPEESDAGDDASGDDAGDDTGGDSGSAGDNGSDDASDGASGHGNGPEAAPDPGMCGGILDAAPDESGINEAKAEMESAVRQALSIARAANAGTLPAHLERLVDDLNAPRVSWRDALADFVNDAATRAVCWTRPNKRFIGSAFILPGSVADSVGKGVVVFDTSGSINDKTTAAFRDEAQGILDDGRVESLVVIYCHAAVSGEAEFSAGDTVAFDCNESGGTAFAPAFRHVAANHPDASFIVYLTDLEPGYGPDAWGPEPDVPVLWAVDGPRRAAPFGTVLPIDPYA